MKKAEVVIGETYLATVAKRYWATVRVDAASPLGGWETTNLMSLRPIRIPTARSFHGPTKLVMCGPSNFFTRFLEVGHEKGRSRDRRGLHREGK